jgi:hypothetical protein
LAIATGRLKSQAAAAADSSPVPFHAVQRIGDAGRLGAGGTDQLHRFTEVPAGIVVDDQHLALEQRGADQEPAFAVVLGFLAVVGKRHIAALFRQRHRGGGGEDDALVGRPENHVKLYGAAADGFCIKTRQLQYAVAIIEQAGVEEVRRGASGFGDECAKTQYLLAQRKTNKILTKIAHSHIPLYD